MQRETPPWRLKYRPAIASRKPPDPLCGLGGLAAGRRGGPDEVVLLGRLRQIAAAVVVVVAEALAGPGHHHAEHPALALLDQTGGRACAVAPGRVGPGDDQHTVDPRQVEQDV